MSKLEAEPIHPILSLRSNERFCGCSPKEASGPILEYFVNRVCTPEWHLEETVLPSHNLMYLYAGRCQYWLDGRCYELQAGDVIYSRKGAVRKASTPAEDSMHCYALNFRLSGEEPEHAVLPAHMRIGLDDVLLSDFGRLNQVWLENRPGGQLMAHGLLCMLLGHLTQLGHEPGLREYPDPRIETTRRHIADHLTAHFSVEALAGRFGLNPVYFGWLFHQQTGSTIKAYVNKLRLSRARDLLASGQGSVLETSIQCGFTDPVYFSKAFKRMVGISPLHYQLEARQIRMMEAVKAAPAVPADAIHFS